MATIKEVVFYFAIPLENAEGVPDENLPPESHRLTWQEVVDNVGFSLSTGETMYTERPNPANDHELRIVNGFYFGSGVHGPLLATQYIYSDGTEGWISRVLIKGSSSKNLEVIIGSWIKGLTFKEIQQHINWKGTPYIGLESHYVDILIERIVPEPTLILRPMQETILKGESVTFTYEYTDYCEGEKTVEWAYENSVIRELPGTSDEFILQFQAAGTYTVKLTVKNTCGQSSSQVAVITVTEPQEEPCSLQLDPSIATIRLGQTITIEAIHNSETDGQWYYDLSMEILEESNKRLTVKPTSHGSYRVSYQVGACQESALIYVIAAPDEEDDEEKLPEPPPPTLPNTPPDTTGTPPDEWEWMNQPIAQSVLYGYPQTMKRNARYRGPRESEKVLLDHSEQLYDIRQLTLTRMRQTTEQNEAIASWFGKNMPNQTKTLARSTYLFPQEELPKTVAFQPISRAMVQWNRSGVHETAIGLEGMKKRMMQLEERIAEAERRYQAYENTYE